MNNHALETTARALAAPGKGILAADESLPTIAKRFKSINVEPTDENRRAYRELLFTTQGLNEGISGVILFDETIRQQTTDGISFVEVLNDAGILPGVKVDKGITPMAGFEDEKITEGMDGLRERLAEWVRLGARFTKWRALITIGEGIPTSACLEANAHLLARFAALSQEAGLVPIVEPEVLMDGTHTIHRHEQVTGAALDAVFHALRGHRVHLEGMLLKPNMVLSGKECPERADTGEVAAATLRCMRRHVPAAVPGLMFLSGGQGDVEATVNLNAMNRLGGNPWELSFSFGRALQAPALKAWAGKPENIRLAQEFLRQRAVCNSAARFGSYSAAMEVAAIEAPAL